MNSTPRPLNFAGEEDVEFGLCDRSTAGDRDGAQLLQQFDGRKRAARGRRRDGKPSTGIGGPSVDTFGLHFGVWNVRQRPRLCRLLSPPVSADHLQPVSPVPQFLNQKTIRGLLRDALSLFLSHFILHNANPPPPHKLILLPKKEGGDVGKEKEKKRLRPSDLPLFRTLSATGCAAKTR